MLKCSGGVVKLLLAFGDVAHLTKRRHSKVRTTLVSAQESESVEEALCVKTNPHMDQAPIFLVPLALLPAEVLWDGSDVNYMPPTEKASDDGSDRLMADVV